MEDLWHVQNTEPGAKSIVFSQFVDMLELIEHRLTHAGIRCVRLCGSLSAMSRDRVINAFRTDPFISVFLISLKAGGMALNLTAASRVFLMDPWWNPAVEYQAMDRIHRLGQHRSITITRYIVSGTIEERILSLQEKKVRQLTTSGFCFIIIIQFILTAFCLYSVSSNHDLTHLLFFFRRKSFKKHLVIK